MKLRIAPLSLIGLSLFYLSLSGCSYFIDKLDQSYQVVDTKGKDVGLFFSHNVNGETHPCGCRHFPLGGLPQVAGAFEKFKSKEQVIYIDSGDTLFSSPIIPKNLEKSLTHNAEKLASGLAKVGLKFWVPGDQDFALGTDFINKTAEKNKISLILSNLKDKKTFKHKELVLIQNGPHKLFLIGLILPSILPEEYASLFEPPEVAFQNILVKLKEKGYDEKNPFHRLITISHSGIDADKKLAKKYSNIDWIIGAHTMNFLRFPQEQGKTKIVQVLSRNHYLGHITFSSKKDKSGDKYEIIEVRDELKDELKPNPYLAWIDKHKEEMSVLQKQEQGFGFNEDSELEKYATHNSCVDCHDAQNTFWQKTSHSLAYQTLVISKEENNLACVKCHSLGLKEKRGFDKISEMVKFNSEVVANEEMKKKYWKELQESFGPIKSVRKLSPDDRKKYASLWSEHDSKFKVEKNFANVQCLNCHTQHHNHPFDKLSPEPTRAQKKQRMQDRCIECHNSDQSPEWYLKQSNGLPGSLNKEVLEKMTQKVACPKLAE